MQFSCAGVPFPTGATGGSTNPAFHINDLTAPHMKQAAVSPQKKQTPAAPVETLNGKVKSSTQDFNRQSNHMT